MFVKQNGNFLNIPIFQIIFSKLNPYIWDRSSAKVNSPVVEFSLDDCSKKGKSRRKRATSNTGLGADINIELALDPQPQETINATQPDKYGMVYNHLNITEDPKPVQISVYPLTNWLVSQYFTF